MSKCDRSESKTKPRRAKPRVLAESPATADGDPEAAAASMPAPADSGHEKKGRPVPLVWNARAGRIAGPEPRGRTALRRFVCEHFGVQLPEQALCPHHQGPMDYLEASFIDQQDVLVWANRGGGKTYCAAIATLLDALCRPPMKICVLGGSFDQSSRLADYIRQMLEGMPDLVSGRMTRECVKLVSGSQIHMLGQSQTSVRGRHVQKIRCDEVDLFDPDIWRAVQFATRSAAEARGSIEVLSTLHRRGGLMQKLVDEARERSNFPAAKGYRLIQWCLWDVIERCPESRTCSGCVLEEDCRGIARKGSGFYRIDDAITIKSRSSRAAWESEMLCRGGQREDLVFPEFDPAVHVRPAQYDPSLELYRAIDFGYRSPLVCLWLQISKGGEVRVLDEYVECRRPLPQHAIAIRQRDMGPVRATYVDPAGRQRELSTGQACTEVLASAGITCTSRASTIVEGLELLRCALAPATGGAVLLIHPRCSRLIDAFESYHYQPGSSADGDARPIKDGPDHCIDALRYFFINRMWPNAEVKRRTY